ncbi:VOC family protein [Stackebrandtia nassauensis]|uniref:Glyoxalase/bleomycin resistance protein/dioxygenase n=1 Tax=Stackebrandtia nassauensis (strain DSM 44728 / CIP 108903 / NRRL B-16338 / NBRC 102104 / LLR-40K-21) TaxID=446470 RepID=D3QBD6_STANL|nr:VOC family protein [Stackebrandtia nassauensis]ADD42818.1 Glyoxalase/bleomycin resistance protein/dioxygenase [Stackebrandtia nassauensis DSM 44728]
MPHVNGFHHVSLSVSDVDASLEWYQRVLGFEVLARRGSDGLDKAILADADRTVAVVLVGHGPAAVPGDFDERRTGMDHLGFAVTDRAQLEAWAARLDELGVARSQIKAGSTGELIAFRDPDNIALEFYTR